MEELLKLPVKATKGGKVDPDHVKAALNDDEFINKLTDALNTNPDGVIAHHKKQGS